MRIVSLIDANLIINILPQDAVLENVHYISDDRNRKFITDDQTFTVNISEFVSHWR